jgi:hypothetical protein
MGFFKDINQINRQSKEISKDWDPGQQTRDATARMAAVTQQMAQANAALAAPPADAIDATAQVVSVGNATGMLNSNPIVPVELMILQTGGPPRPVSTSVVVPMTQLVRLQAGATVPVKLSASDPSALAIDWSAPS